MKVFLSKTGQLADQEDNAAMKWGRILEAPIADEFASRRGVTLKAGGFGLNLTAASYVVLFDPWWNPAVEDQATDRAHRIGQKRTVYSVKLITKGTVEEKVLALQNKKKAIIAATIESDEGIMQSMTWADIQNILDL
jgi:SNF2 family DNA or RNA helicase